MSQLWKFGSLTLPLTTQMLSDELTNVVPRRKQLRSDGERAIRGSLAGRMVRLSIDLTKGPIGGVNIQSTIDGLKNACLSSAPADFYNGDSTRYLRSAHVEKVIERYDRGMYGRIVAVDVDVFAPDPYYWSPTVNTDTWAPGASGSTHAVVTSGNAVARPQYKLTVPGVGAVSINWTLLNTSIGDAFTLIGAVTGGNVIIVDAYAQTVTISGVDSFSLFDGDLFIIRAGGDTLEIDYTGTGPSQIQTVWQNRYY